MEIMPEIRYTDTAYLIHKQWRQNAQGFLAFPSILLAQNNIQNGLKSAIVSENLHIAESSRSKGEKCEDEINNNVQTVVAKVPDDQKQLVKLKLNQSHKNASKRKALKKFPLPEQPKSSSESEEDSDVTVVDYSSPIRISEKESYARIDDIIAAANSYGDHQSEKIESPIAPFERQRNHYPRQQSNTSTNNIWQLYYVTEKILAAVLPQKTESLDNKLDYDNAGTSAARREDASEKTLINMMEQKHGKNYRIFDLESCFATVSLEKLCELCKHIDSWLSSDKKKVVVLQDRGSYQRLGTAVAAFLQYQRICSSFSTNGYSSETSEATKRNWQDLDIYSMKKFLEDLIGPLTVPSHKRYIEYFSGLLSGDIKLNSLAINLKFIKMESPPCLHHNASLNDSEWRSFIKIFESERCVFISDIYVMPISTKQFVYEIKSSLKLRGDIFINFYHVNNKSLQTTVISSLQFHTCAISNTQITFSKADLNLACDDNKFSYDHKVTLIFESNKKLRSIESSGMDYQVFQNPLIRIEPLSNFDGDDMLHTQGPLDGSLYATITKSQSISPLTSRNVQSIDAAASDSNRLLSTILEWDNNLQQGRGIDAIDNASYRHTIQPPRRKVHTVLDSRNHARSPLTLSIDSGISSNEMSHKQNVSALSSITWHSQTSPQVRQGAKHNELDNLLSEMLLTVQELPDVNPSPTFDTRKRIQSPNMQSTPKSPKSPMSYYMDQNQNQSYSTINKKAVLSSEAVASSRNRDFCETSSQTSTTLTPTESGRNTPMCDEQTHNDSDFYYHQQRTDTLKRRENQPNGITVQNPDQSSSYVLVDRSQSQQFASGQNANIPYHAREDSRPFTYVGDISEAKMIKMHSGLSSPSMVRKALGRGGQQTITTTTTTTKKLPINDFEEMLHSRHNEKYSFGDKTPTSDFNGSSSLHDKSHAKRFNTSGRNASESASYYRYNKSALGSNTSIENYNTESDGGYQFEPLRRSNTMDGSFGRDGLSGQTWLQLQQQKLRARKATQPRGIDFVDHSVNRRSQTLSPVRNYHTITTKTVTNNNSQRNNNQNNYRGDQYIVPIRRTHEMAAKPLKIETLESYAVNNNNSNNNAHTLDNYNTINSNYSRDIQRWPAQSPDSPSYSIKPSSNYGSDNKNLKCITDDEDLFNQQTLDHLLESLAIESDTTEKYLSELDENENFEINEISEDIDNLENLEIPSRSTITTLTTANRSFNNNGNEISISNVPADGLLITVNNHASINKESYNININHNYNIVSNKKRPFTTATIKSPSLAPRNNGCFWDQMRNESFSSYRSETDAELSPSVGSFSRPETPAFPVTPRTPQFGYSGNSLPPKSPTLQRHNNSTWSIRSERSTAASVDRRRDLSSNRVHEIANLNETVSTYTSRRNSATSNTNSEPQEVAPQNVKFARDSSKFWYKPTLSREETINLLRNAAPGTFLVRDSTTFANAFGLVVKVAQAPIGSKNPNGGDELVRHFLVEPTVRGVRLKGCSNEPVFSSLSALIYQHSVTPLALPCRLLIPDRDMQQFEFTSPAQQQLVSVGAACNVLYLSSVETESLTGPQAVRKSIALLFERRPLPTPTQVHFKVSQQGITLTDSTRQLFFRKNYPSNTVTYFGLDPDDHRWSLKIPSGDVPITNYRIFAFVAKKSAASNDNQCHLFCELEASQPAAAIVSFANKVILDGASSHSAPQI